MEYPGRVPDGHWRGRGDGSQQQQRGRGRGSGDRGSGGRGNGRGTGRGKPVYDGWGYEISPQVERGKEDDGWARYSDPRALWAPADDPRQPWNQISIKGQAAAQQPREDARQHPRGDYGQHPRGDSGQSGQRPRGAYGQRARGSSGPQQRGAGGQQSRGFVPRGGPRGRGSPNRPQRQPQFFIPPDPDAYAPADGEQWIVPARPHDDGDVSMDAYEDGHGSLAAAAQPSTSLGTFYAPTPPPAPAPASVPSFPSTYQLQQPSPPKYQSSTLQAPPTSAFPEPTLAPSTYRPAVQQEPHPASGSGVPTFTDPSNPFMKFLNSVTGKKQGGTPDKPTVETNLPPGRSPTTRIPSPTRWNPFSSQGNHQQQQPERPEQWQYQQAEQQEREERQRQWQYQQQALEPEPKESTTSFEEWSRRQPEQQPTISSARPATDGWATPSPAPPAHQFALRPQKSSRQRFEPSPPQPPLYVNPRELQLSPPPSTTFQSQFALQPSPQSRFASSTFEPPENFEVPSTSHQFDPEPQHQFPEPTYQQQSSSPQQRYPQQSYPTSRFQTSANSNTLQRQPTLREPDTRSQRQAKGAKQQLQQLQQPGVQQGVRLPNGLFRSISFRPNAQESARPPQLSSPTALPDPPTQTPDNDAPARTALPQPQTLSLLQRMAGAIPFVPKSNPRHTEPAKPESQPPSRPKDPRLPFQAKLPPSTKALADAQIPPSAASQARTARSASEMVAASKKKDEEVKPKAEVLLPQVLSTAETQLAAAREADKRERKEREARWKLLPTEVAYKEMEAYREKEMDTAVRLKYMNRPGEKMHLNDAITMVGTCEDMCPLREIVDRIRTNMVSDFERNPTTGEPEYSRFVKRDARQDAEGPPVLPSDLRPTETLIRTTRYLLDELITRENFADAHEFVWNRIRAVKKDFTIQGINGIEAIYPHEKMARFYVYAIWEMWQYPRDKFVYDQALEYEQLRKTLTSLHFLYNDNHDVAATQRLEREAGDLFPNEALFRGLQRIIHLRPKSAAPLEMDPVALRTPLGVLVMDLWLCVRGNLNMPGTGDTPSVIKSVGAIWPTVRFFTLLARPETPVLLVALLETEFNNIRSRGLRKLTAAHRRVRFNVSLVTDWLKFDSDEETTEFLTEYGFEVTEGPDGVMKTHLPQTREMPRDEEVSVPRRRSQRLVGSRLAAVSLMQITEGKIPEPSFDSLVDYPDLGLVLKELGLDASEIRTDWPLPSKFIGQQNGALTALPGGRERDVENEAYAKSPDEYEEYEYEGEDTVEEVQEVGDVGEEEEPDGDLQGAEEDEGEEEYAEFDELDELEEEERNDDGGPEEEEEHPDAPPAGSAPSSVPSLLQRLGPKVGQSDAARSKPPSRVMQPLAEQQTAHDRTGATLSGSTMNAADISPAIVSPMLQPAHIRPLEGPTDGESQPPKAASGPGMWSQEDMVNFFRAKQQEHAHSSGATQPTVQSSAAIAQEKGSSFNFSAPLILHSGQVPKLVGEHGEGNGFVPKSILSTIPPTTLTPSVSFFPGEFQLETGSAMPETAPAFPAFSWSAQSGMRGVPVGGPPGSVAAPTLANDLGAASHATVRATSLGSWPQAGVIGDSGSGRMPSQMIPPANPIVTPATPSASDEGIARVWQTTAAEPTEGLAGNESLGGESWHPAVAGPVLVPGSLLVAPMPATSEAPAAVMPAFVPASALLQSSAQHDSPSKEYIAPGAIPAVQASGTPLSLEGSSIGMDSTPRSPVEPTGTSAGAVPTMETKALEEAERQRASLAQQNLGEAQYRDAVANWRLGEPPRPKEYKRAPVVPIRRFDDASVAAEMERKRQLRARFNNPGTLQEVVLQTVLSQRPPELRVEPLPGWQIWVVPSGLDPVTASWFQATFRAKLERPHCEGRIFECAVTEPSRGVAPPSPGLIVFECSASLLEADRDDVHHADRERLDFVLRSIPTYSSYLPALLVVYWNTHITIPPNVAEEMINRRLGLSSLRGPLLKDKKVLLLADFEDFIRDVKSLKLDGIGVPKNYKTPYDYFSDLAQEWRMMLHASVRSTGDDIALRVFETLLQSLNVMVEKVWELGVEGSKQCPIDLPAFVSHPARTRDEVFRAVTLYLSSPVFYGGVEIEEARASLLEALRNEEELPVISILQQLSFYLLGRVEDHVVMRDDLFGLDLTLELTRSFRCTLFAVRAQLDTLYADRSSTGKASSKRAREQDEPEQARRVSPKRRRGENDSPTAPTQPRSTSKRGREDDETEGTSHVSPKRHKADRNIGQGSGSASPGLMPNGSPEQPKPGGTLKSLQAILASGHAALQASVPSYPG